MRTVVFGSGLLILGMAAIAPARSAENSPLAWLAQYYAPYYAPPPYEY